MPTWTEVVEFFTRNWQNLRAAPLAFLVLSLAGLAAGAWLASLYYSATLSELTARIDSRDDQIARYRVALGIDPAKEGSLLELSNAEMRAKAATTSSNLRKLADEYARRAKEPVPAGLDAKAKHERSMALMREISDKFQRTLRADAINVDNELRRRLGPKSLGSIVGLPPTFYSASDGAPIGMVGLMSSANMGMDAPLLSVLANGIDQMSQLIPEK